MIATAKAAAAETGVGLSLIHGRIEEFPTTQTYDVITIGRALHWMEHSAALPVLERIVADSGRILICGASGVETPKTAWVKSYKEVRRAWMSRLDERRGRGWKEWFANSCFGGLGKNVRHRMLSGHYC